MEGHTENTVRQVECNEFKQNIARGASQRRGDQRSYRDQQSPVGRVKSCASTWGAEVGLQVKDPAKCKGSGLDSEARPSNRERKAHCLLLAREAENNRCK